MQRAQLLRRRRGASRAASRRSSRSSSAPRSVARRSGVPTQHSAPAASIAARASSLRVVMRTACPSGTIAAASAGPGSRLPTISIRATARASYGAADRAHGSREASTTIRCPSHDRARAPTTPDVVTMDKIVALCKRRGFVFPSSEIYGGVGSTYDYGHYGVLLKNNVKDEWWRAMLQERDDIVAIDSAILQHPRVWEASGHLAGFTDPLVDCRTCKQRFRADHLGELACGRKPSKHPGETRRVRPDRGARLQPDVRDDDRPGQGVRRDRLPAPGDRAGHLHQLQERAAVLAQEAAVRDRPGRQVLPQRDHARQLHLPHARVRADGDGVLRAARRGRSSWFEHWLGERERWYVELGIRPDHLRLRAHDPDELSHYSSGTSDVEYLFSRSAGRSSRGSPTAATST